MRSTLVIVLVSLASLSCKREKPPRPVLPPEPTPAAQRGTAAKGVPIGALRRDGFVSYAVYFELQPKLAPTTVFKRLSSQSTFKVLERPGDEPQSAVYGWAPELASAPPPSVETLRFFGRGLTETQRATVASSKSVFTLAFTYPADSIPASLKAADDLVSAFATETGGFIWDSETRELFTADAFRSLRLRAWDGAVPQVSRHVNVHAYRDGDGYRAVSVGMAKLGLPDVCVNRFAGDRMSQIDLAVQLALQAVHDRPLVATPGLLETGPVKFPADIGTPAPGDSPNRLIELKLSAALLDELAASNKVVGARPDDAALLAASERARARLSQLKNRWQQDLAEGTVLRVKAAFVEGAETEYMWVDVQHWEGTQISGVLTNAPRFKKSLSAGSVVSVREADVFDWVRHTPDGGSEGGETTRILTEAP